MNSEETKTGPLRNQCEYDPYFFSEEPLLTRIRPDSDGRKIVKDTTLYPLSAHGRLVMMFDGKSVYGSGTLISPRFVLTSANNIYSSIYNREPDSILFIPALKGEEYPYGAIGVKRYFYPEEYKERRSENYAVLELEEDIGDNTGIIEMRMHRADEVEDKECYIYGYPSYINRIENNYLYGMIGRVSLNEERDIFRYTIDTSSGQTGSGIYYYSKEEDKYFIVGIHTTTSFPYNEGTLLTPQRIERIQVWIASIMIPTRHNLPSLASDIYGRNTELVRLRDFFKYNIRFALIGLSGIAGVGKSMIALKFAMKCIGSYDYIWWINAETQESFRNSVLGLAETLRIEGRTYQEILSKLKVVLNSRYIQYLIIFDNLEDQNIAKDLYTTRGHYIITTRLEYTDFEKIKVDTLPSDASVKLLKSRLNYIIEEELVTLSNFLQNLPLALVQAAHYITGYRIEIKDYIQNFSEILSRDTKYKNITSQNIDSLCEESKDILGIACLGYNDNIPYDMLYKVFCYKYPDTSEFDFNYYLGEIVNLNILSYDIKNGLLKMHRVIQEASILLLSLYISDELIQQYSDYLHSDYNPQADIYTKEESGKIKYLTLHAETFLNRYKSKTLFTRTLLIQSRIAYSYMEFFSNYNISITYIKTIEQSLKLSTSGDLGQDQTYIIIQELYNTMGKYRKSEDYE